MQAMPPPEAQVLPDAAETKPAEVRRAAGPATPRPVAEPVAGPEPAHTRPAEPIQVALHTAASAGASVESADLDSAPTSDPGAAGPTVIPRRPVVEDGRRVRADVPWLGIGSWLLLCGALFASLVGWPHQTALDRLTELAALDRLTAIFWGDAPSATSARTPQGDATPAEDAPLPADQQDWSAITPGPADQEQALPPTELAPPIRSEAPADPPAGEGPPLPRFKPKVDEIAATFSSAFYEIGARLQQQGEFEAAVHMRRQGSKLDPFKADL
jgi:hypothetical protein